MCVFVVVVFLSCVLLCQCLFALVCLVGCLFGFPINGKSFRGGRFNDVNTFTSAPFARSRVCDSVENSFTLQSIFHEHNCAQSVSEEKAADHIIRHLLNPSNA